MNYQKYKVLENWQDSSSAGEEQGITENHKLNLRQQHHTVMKKANNVLG